MTVLSAYEETFSGLPEKTRAAVMKVRELSERQDWGGIRSLEWKRDYGFDDAGAFVRVMAEKFPVEIHNGGFTFPFGTIPVGELGAGGSPSQQERQAGTISDGFNTTAAPDGDDSERQRNIDIVLNSIIENLPADVVIENDPLRGGKHIRTPAGDLFLTPDGFISSGNPFGEFDPEDENRRRAVLAAFGKATEGQLGAFSMDVSMTVREAVFVPSVGHRIPIAMPLAIGQNVDLETVRWLHEYVEDMSKFFPELLARPVAAPSGPMPG